jgi:hypothetical protein
MHDSRQKRVAELGALGCALINMRVPSDDEASMIRDPRLQSRNTMPTPTEATPTEAILEEDGAEITLVQVAERVAEAEEVILRLLQEDAERDWSIRELQDAAAYSNSLSPSVISIAFIRLRDAGVVRIDTNLRAHAA